MKTMHFEYEGGEKVNTKYIKNGDFETGFNLRVFPFERWVLFPKGGLLKEEDMMISYMLNKDISARYLREAIKDLPLGEYFIKNDEEINAKLTDIFTDLLSLIEGDRDVILTVVY